MPAAIPLTAIGGGINRLRVKGGADTNSLYDLLNGYVTQSGTVKVRPGTFRNANIGQYSGAGMTKGLLAYQGQFHVFASSLVSVPPNYALHVLGYPYASAISNSIVVAPPSASSDPYWSSVTGLYQPMGANGNCASIGFPAGTVGANASITKAPTLYSGATVVNNNGANYLGGYAAAVPLNITSSASLFTYASWTMEAFFTVDAVGGSGQPFTIWDYGGETTLPYLSEFGLTLVSQGNGTYVFSVADSTYNSMSVSYNSSPISLVTGTFHHVALVNNNGNGTLYLDGVAIITQSTGSPIIPVNRFTLAQYALWGCKNASPNIVVGSFTGYSGACFAGRVGDVRFTSLARYTANFTAPTAPFPGPTCGVVSPPLKEIHFSAPYLGGIYVVAEFSGIPSALAAEYGTVFHYWIQSSTGGDNSNAWQANTDYVAGDVVIPTTPNGFTYIATRKSVANPLWQPNTAEAIGNVVEPNIANGFQYTVTAVLGTTPTTGALEPTWPTSDGATVLEDSSLANDQSVTLVSVAPTAPTPPVPSRYSGLYNGPGSTS